MNSSSAEQEVLRSIPEKKAPNMPWFMCAPTHHLSIVQGWKLLHLRQKWLSLELQIKLSASIAWVCDANGIMEQYNVGKEIEALLDSRPQWAQ